VDALSGATRRKDRENRTLNASVSANGSIKMSNTLKPEGAAATEFLLTQADLKNLADYLKYTYDLSTDSLYDNILHWLVEPGNV
jgi:hypothetical protein